jgi:hypothetical protein
MAVGEENVVSGYFVGRHLGRRVAAKKWVYQ